MKTAMQELFEWLENSSDIENDILDWETVKTNALEKEKEQIIEAFIDGEDGVPAEEYYNQTYNQQEDKTFKQKSKWTTQKQHIIDIMKADEDDGLYKLLDTDPDKKH